MTTSLRPFRFRHAALVTALAFAVSGCTPQVDEKSGSEGFGKSDSQTSGTASPTLLSPLDGVVALRPKPPEIDTNSTGALELRAPKNPEGVTLPFPDAMVAADLEPGKRGGNFTYCSFGDPKTFDPITANESSSNDLIDRMFDWLVNYDFEKQAYYPQLLKELVTENGDTSRWLLKLRAGLKWSDGHPLTADDIMFAAQVIADEKIATPARDTLQVAGKPIKFEKVDETTVRAICAAPTGLFHVLIQSLVPIPKHILEKDYKAGTYETALNINVDPAKVVGSGPFRLKLYTSGERTILERNAHYYKYDRKGVQLPYLDTVTFSSVPNQDSVLLRFQSGGADALSGPRPQNLFGLRDEQKKGNYTLYDCGAGEGVSYLWFNMKTGSNPTSGKPYMEPAKYDLYSNTEFRRACLHALNKEAIINSVLRGQAVSASSDCSPALTFWHNPNVRKHPFDLSKSKQILDSMEMKDRDKDGIRETTSGQKLSFTFITNKGNKSREEIATLLSADLKAAGIQAIPQYMDFNALVTKINDTFEYDACYLGFGGSIHPVTSMNTWRSNGRTHFWNPMQEKPATTWEAQIDALCDQFTTALSPMDQQKAFYRMQEIASENVSALPLFVSKVYHAVRNTIGNVKPSSLTVVFWNVDEFYIK